MPGSSGKLEIARDENGLTITIPGGETSDYAIALKIIPKA